MTIRQDYIDRLIALANEFGPHFGVGAIDPGMFAEAPAAQDPVRQRAEDLAGAASQRFGEILPELPQGHPGLTERMGAPDWLKAQQERVKDGPLQPGQALINPLQPVMDTAALGAELTGVPSVIRGSRRLAEGIDKGDALRAVAGAGEAALGLVPGVSAVRAAAPAMRTMFGTAPRAMATVAAGTIPGGVVSAQDAAAAGSSDKIAQMMEKDPEIIRLRRQIDDTVNKAASAAKESIPGQSSANADKSRARAADVYDKMLNGTTGADGTRVPGLRERLQAAEQRVRDGYMETAPFRERYPAVAGALPAAGLALAAGVPFGLKAVANATTGAPWSTASRLQREIDKGRQAMISGTPDERSLQENVLNAFVGREPGRMGRTWQAVTGPAAAAVAGGSLAAEAQLFPDQFDWYNLPEGPEKEAARKRALDPLTFLSRAALGSLIGYSGYKAGDLVPRRDPNWPAAIGVRDALRARGASGGGSGAPPAPPAGGSQSGNGIAPPQLPPPTPGSAVSPPQPPMNAFASYDQATYGPISRQYVDELLTTGHPARQALLAQPDTVAHMVDQLQSRYAVRGLPPVDPGGLRARAQGTYDAAEDIARIFAGMPSAKRKITAPEIRSQVLDAVTGKPTTLALPAAVAAGAAAERVNSHWEAQPRGDDGRFDGPPDPKRWKRQDE